MAAQGFFQRFFSRRQRRQFFAWQIELTTRCPLMCTMCVKMASGKWEKNDMRFEDFEKILPYLTRVENVVLEGWGDPLLYPRIIDVVAAVRRQGAKPGFVCCGNGMSDDRMRGLIEAGLEFIGFSFSGATRAVHNNIRVNSDFNRLIDTVCRFSDIIKKGNHNIPKVHLVYLMLKDNIHEVPQLVERAHEAGVPEVNLINIIQISTPEQDAQKSFSCSGASPYREIIREAREKARKLNIRLNVPLMEVDEVDVCNENPLRNVYISSTGEVSPCVFLYPPVTSPMRRYYCGRECSVEKLSFGNIFRESFDSIWERPEYMEFRGRFVGRRNKMREIFAALEERRLVKDDSLPDPPLQCQTCHEILGL